MKKYKLIKKYPGSPEIGTIVRWNRGRYYFNKSMNKAYLLGQVESYPEFWEEVKEVEKDNFIYVSEVSNIKVYPDKKYWFIDCPIGYNQNTYGELINKKSIEFLHKELIEYYKPIAFDNKDDAKDYCFRNQPLYTYEDIKEIAMDIIALYSTEEYNRLVWDEKERDRVYDYLLKECIKRRKRPIN